MSRLTIDLGTAGNPATGDSLRTAFNKVNTNFAELYAELGGDSLDTISFTNNTISSGITNGTLVLEGNGTGAVDIEGIQVNDNQIITTTTNANLLLDGNGTGTVVINGLNFPTADGTAGQVLKTDGAGNLSFTAVDPGSITLVGDDSTGTAITIGETFKIAGTSNITTAVSGDTLTITGPNLSSYLTSETSHADVVVDGDFGSQGIMLRGASSGTYSILTDNSSNWNTAFGWGNHASAGYLTNSPITVVGDDSTGITLNTGETIRIAGTQNITTAVAGDTLTITGPDLSSYLTSVPSTIEVNEISSSDSSAIQINDAVNISGALTANVINIGNASSINFDGGTGSNYSAPTFADGTGTINKAGVYKSANNANNALFSFGANGAGVMSVVMDGSLFIGSALPSNNGGLNTNFGGWLVVQSGGKFGGDINTLGGLIFDDALTAKIQFPDGSLQTTARAMTIVGDDSTGTAVNIGETFKIAGTQNITTAVSGDTLTITGSKNIDVNEISSGDSSAIQINDAVNVSGAGTFHGSVRFNAGYTEKINALTSSSTITVNCATASIHTVTLAVSTGFVISNLPTGGTVTLIITQGGSGSYTATFGTDGSTTVKFPGGAPTLSTAVGAIDVVTIFNDGTNYLGNIAKAYAA